MYTTIFYKRRYLLSEHRETLESKVTVTGVRQSTSEEHESIGSRDTGIDLNPVDDCLPPVPVYHRASSTRSSDRRLLNAAHRRRSRSTAAVDDTEPRVIDADDETDGTSVKDGVAGRRRYMHSVGADYSR